MVSYSTNCEWLTAREVLFHKCREVLNLDVTVISEINLINFYSEILNEYAMKLKTVTEVLSKAIAKSLNLEENSFLNQFGDQALMQVRFNFYPPCSRPDLVHGIKPHTDRSGITILLQDREVEGLQIRVDGKWYRVPVIPHALVVNLGDQMQVQLFALFFCPFFLFSQSLLIKCRFIFEEMVHAG